MIFSQPSLAGENVSETQLYEELRVQWGTEYYSTEFDLISGDVTCDEAQDFVVSRKYFDNPDGPLFQVLIISNHRQEATSGTTVSLGFRGASQQIGLCVSPQGIVDMPIVTEIEEWSDQELEDVFGNSEGICSRAISISDLLCDTNHLFFLSGSTTDSDHRFLHHRN